MARRWFGRDEQPAEASQSEVDPAAEGPEIPRDGEAPDAADLQDDEPGPTDDDQDEDSSEPKASKEHTPAEGPGLAGRLAAATGHAITRLGAGAIARLPVLGAAMVPRLPRLVLSVGGGLLLCASFPSVNWWWAAVVAAA